MTALLDHITQGSRTLILSRDCEGAIVDRRFSAACHPPQQE
jgi:hypothetical protein